jgi:hypothetical protein
MAEGLKLSWTQAICDLCWLRQFPGKQPVRARNEMGVSDHEQCCYCGTATESGIYMRADPYSVRYPRVDDTISEPK